MLPLISGTLSTEMGVTRPGKCSSSGNWVLKYEPLAFWKLHIQDSLPYATGLWILPDCFHSVLKQILLLCKIMGGDSVDSAHIQPGMSCPSPMNPKKNSFESMSKIMCMFNLCPMGWILIPYTLELSPIPNLIVLSCLIIPNFSVLLQVSKFHTWRQHLSTIISYFHFFVFDFPLFRPFLAPHFLYMFSSLFKSLP